MERENPPQNAAAWNDVPSESDLEAALRNENRDVRMPSEYSEPIQLQTANRRIQGLKCKKYPKNRNVKIEGRIRLHYRCGLKWLSGQATRLMIVTRPVGFRLQRLRVLMFRIVVAVAGFIDQRGCVFVAVVAGPSAGANLLWHNRQQAEHQR